MGSCTTKQSCKSTEKKRRTASTLPEKSIRKGVSSQKDIQIDLEHNDISYIDQYQEDHEQEIVNECPGCGANTQILHQQQQNYNSQKNICPQGNCCAIKKDERHSISNAKGNHIAKESYVSCFHDPTTPQDLIQTIVLLEEACITLKFKMEQEKLKQQKKIQDNLKKYGPSLTQQSNNVLTTQRQQSSTHFSVEQNSNSIQNIQQNNEIHCYNTIIKLADFIQEKSQKLWEDPEDVEIHDALSSLFWASKMLQLDCLVEFKSVVSKNMNIYYDDKQQSRNAHMKCSFNNFSRNSKQVISYS